MAIARSDLALRANSLLAVEGGEGEQGKERKKERKKEKKARLRCGGRVCALALLAFSILWFGVQCLVNTCNICAGGWAMSGVRETEEEALSCTLHSQRASLVTCMECDGGGGGLGGSVCKFRSQLVALLL